MAGYSFSTSIQNASKFNFACFSFSILSLAMLTSSSSFLQSKLSLARFKFHKRVSNPVVLDNRYRWKIFNRASVILALLLFSYWPPAEPLRGAYGTLRFRGTLLKNTVLDRYLQWSLRYAARYKSKMAAATVLHFAISGILGCSNAYIANIYQCTKFDKNIFIYDRDMAKNQKFKMAAAAILNFAKGGMLGYSNPCMANIYQCTKFDENIFICDRDGQKSKIQDGGRRHVGFCQKWDIGLQ